MADAPRELLRMVLCAPGSVLRGARRRLRRPAPHPRLTRVAQRGARRLRSKLLPLLLVPALAACGAPWNNPYPDDSPQAAASTIYSAFTARPKHLDPARAYSSDTYVFVGQIYQPPLQYHYLKRPFELIPFAAEAVPAPRYFGKDGRELPADAPLAEVASTVYDVKIRPGQRYQPHPALARDAGGAPLYHALSAEQLARIHTLFDFAQTGTREVVAADFVHQIKRLAHPRLQSPVLGKMGNYIVGLNELAQQLREKAKGLPRDAFIDLADFDLAGAQAIDRYTLRIRLKGKYPQFVYWLAMPFFAPMPPEADRFYAQPGLARRNITLDAFPIGSGPYMLSENDPNRRMVLSRNPSYGGETYPAEGAPGDREAGLLRDAGRPLPLTERVVFSLEKEQIPYWNKFLQGWFDTSGISSDTFDQAVQLNAGGEIGISDEMARRGITLETSVATTIFYLGFNWNDTVVGSSDKASPEARERARKLRHAVSIAIDQEEFISVFRNGRAIPAQGPIAPGIIGFRDGEAGLNRYMYEWVDGAARRRSVAEAKRLLAEAGFPNGRDAKTGQPLVLNLDTTGGSPGARSRIEWYVRQLAKIDVQLVPRVTDWNRFQEKLRQGNVQLFTIPCVVINGCTCHNPTLFDRRPFVTACKRITGAYPRLLLPGTQAQRVTRASRPRGEPGLLLGTSLASRGAVPASAVGRQSQSVPIRSIAHTTFMFKQQLRHNAVVVFQMPPEELHLAGPYLS